MCCLKLYFSHIRYANWVFGKKKLYNINDVSNSEFTLILGSRDAPYTPDCQSEAVSCLQQHAFWIFSWRGGALWFYLPYHKEGRIDGFDGLHLPLPHFLEGIDKSPPYSPEHEWKFEGEMRPNPWGQFICIALYPDDFWDWLLCSCCIASFPWACSSPHIPKGCRYFLGTASTW